MRLFFAIDLSDSVQDEIEQLYLPQLQQVRWTAPGQLHLTLAFLGEQPEERLDQIIETAAAISFEPFPLQFSESGHFRSGVIWLGVKPEPALIRLQASLCHALRAQGIKLEQRKYIPHITLGRCRHLSPELLSLMSHQALGFQTRMEVSCYQLKSSRLYPEGACYETEAEFWPE